MRWPARRSLDSCGERRHRAREGLARQRRVESGRLRRFIAGVQPGAEHPVLAPIVERLQEQRGPLGPAVDRHNHPRFGDSREVEELIALPERLLAGTLGRALEDGDGVADLHHDAGAPAANSSAGKISAPVNTGWADGLVTSTSRTAIGDRNPVRMGQSTPTRSRASGAGSSAIRSEDARLSAGCQWLGRKS
jgi:hypothetical protein